MSFRAVTSAECSRWSSHPTLLGEKTAPKHANLCSVNRICVIPYSRPIFAGIFMDKNIFIVLDKCGVNSHFAWQLFWLLDALAK